MTSIVPADKTARDLIDAPEETQNRLAREHNLPDFTTAPAWMDAPGGVVTQRQVMGYRGPLSDFSAGAPWAPLNAADGWVQRIDREKLAEMLKPYFSGGDVAYGENVECADAVLAVLPELMGGAS